MNLDLKDKTILFYDGDCALCNFWVQFCLDRDHKKVLHFAPLQGATAEQLLPTDLRLNNSSVVLWDNQRYLLRSKAIIAVLRKIGYAPDFVFLLRLVPTFLLDKLYDFIARYRYQWFGNNKTCPIPLDEQKHQLLD